MNRCIRIFCQGTSVLGLGLLFLLAVATMSDGLMRSFLSRPIDLVREIGDMVAAIGVSLCLPVALEARSNITLRALDRLRPGAVARIADVFADILVLLVLIGIAWQFWIFAGKTARAGEVTWMMNIPRAPFWYVVDVALWSAAVIQLLVLIRHLRGEGTTLDAEAAP
ncbi:TRAP transporter small permease [Paracoccus sp. 22332]|uniref:TRAP transporter small permease n=1 Tax=Paracoccus sp. 22332 TaxID=3453913 RepID=UPI003F84FEC5